MLKKPIISIITPMHNESLCIDEFLTRVQKAMIDYGQSFEIIAVNDGSTDNTLDLLKSHLPQIPELKIVNLARNAGQWAACYAGIQTSLGDYVVIMDSDLQHLPEEISLLVDKIKEGYDLVSGARQKRKESLIFRRIPSLIANRMLRKITGCDSKDMGGFKCIKGDLARKLRLKAGQHRFLPALIYAMGGSIADVPISAPARFAGQSHYGLTRMFDVMMDIILFWFRKTHKARPIYLFGRISLVFFLISLGLFKWVLFEKLFFGIHMGTRPPFILSMFGFIASMGFLSFGFVLELLSDIHNTVNENLPYAVKEIIKK